MLQDRYKNKRQIIMSHLKKLFRQQGIQNESPIELRCILVTTTKHVRALKVLGVPTEQWGHVLVYIISDRVDAETRKQWELAANSKEFPTFNELREFLDKRCQALENAVPTSRQKYLQSIHKATAPIKVHNTIETRCPVCKEQHHIYQCESFRK